MPGRIRIPELDTAPASVSPRCYTLLREQLGFAGVAVTGALDRRAITHHTGARDIMAGIARGAAAALSAGADLLCLGNPRTVGHSGEKMFRAAHDAVLNAVAAGALRRSRLTEPQNGERPWECRARRRDPHNRTRKKGRPNAAWGASHGPGRPRPHDRAG